MVGSMENYRLHTKKDEDEKNLASKKDVVIGVLLQQAVQALISTLLFAITRSETESTQAQQTSIVVLAKQFFIAMMVIDTWQYFMHHNKFLYKHIHSHHHRLVVPYAFGALYNHPLEVVAARHNWWGPCIPHFRHVSSSFHLLLFVCYTENCRRSLWAMATWQSSPAFV